MTIVKDEHNKSFANSSGDESITSGQQQQHQQQRPAAPITVSSQDSSTPHPAPPLPPPNVPAQNAPVSLICRIPYRKLKLVLKPSAQTLVTPPEESKTQSQSDLKEPPAPLLPPPPPPKSKTKRSSKKSPSKSPVKLFCFCYYCDRKFSTVELRQKHLDQIHSNQSQCKYCKKTIKRIQRLFDHYRRHHSDRFVGCFECFEQYESQSELESHNLHVGHTLPPPSSSSLTSSLPSTVPQQTPKQIANNATKNSTVPVCGATTTTTTATTAVTVTSASVVTRSSISESLNVQQNVLPLIELEQLHEAFGLSEIVTEDAAKIASDNVELGNANDAINLINNNVVETAEEITSVAEIDRCNNDDNEPQHSNLKKLLPLKSRIAVRDDASSEDSNPNSETKEPKDLSELDISTQLDVYDRYLRMKRTRVRNRRKPSASTLDGFAANLGLVKRLSSGKRTSTAAGSAKSTATSSSAAKKRLSGEKSLQKTYLCLVCGLLLESYKVYVRHKENEHSHIFSLNYELIGPELNQLQHVNFLGFNRSRKIETLEQRYESLTLENRLRNRQLRLSRNKKKKMTTGAESENKNEKDEKNKKPLHKCTKCSKDDMTIEQLHQHILICSGLYEWLPKTNTTAKARSSKVTSGSTLTHSNSRKRRKTSNTAIRTTATTATRTSVTMTSTTTTSTTPTTPTTSSIKAKKRKSNDFENDPLPSPKQVKQPCCQTDSDSDENKPLAVVFKKTLKKSFLANGLNLRPVTSSNSDSKEEKCEDVIKVDIAVADETPKPDSLKELEPQTSLPLSKDDLIVEDKSVAADHRIVIKIKKQQTPVALLKEEEDSEVMTDVIKTNTVSVSSDQLTAGKLHKHKKKRKRKNNEIEPTKIVRVMTTDTQNGSDDNGCKMVDDLQIKNSTIETEKKTETKPEPEPKTQIVNVNCCPVVEKQFVPEMPISPVRIDDVIKEENKVVEAVKGTEQEQTKINDVSSKEEVVVQPVSNLENCLQIAKSAVEENVQKQNEVETKSFVSESENETKLQSDSLKMETAANEEILPETKIELKKSQTAAAAATKTEFFCDICRKYYKKEETLQKHKMTIRHISKLSEIEAAEHSKRLELEAATAAAAAAACKVVEESTSHDRKQMSSNDVSTTVASHRRFSQPIRTGPVLLKIPTKGAMKLYADEKPVILSSLPSSSSPPPPLPLSSHACHPISVLTTNPKDQIMQRIFCKNVAKLSPSSSNDGPEFTSKALNGPKQINDFNHNNHNDEDMEIEETKEIGTIETNVNNEQLKDGANKQSLETCLSTVGPLEMSAVTPNKIDFEQELRECIGVASRKSQRKCTSGKQNVLAEQWSSDESCDEDVGRSTSWNTTTINGNGRTTSADETSEDDDCSAAAGGGVGRNMHRKRKRRKPCTTTKKNGTRPYRRRIVSLTSSPSPLPVYQWPPASPPSRSTLPTHQRHSAPSASTASIVPLLSPISSTSITSPPSKPLILSHSPPPLIAFSNGGSTQKSSSCLTNNTLSMTITTATTTATTTTAVTATTVATKNNMAVKSATEIGNGNGTEDDSFQQHGWIVGDSARKLVTLLAHSKSR